MFIPESWISLNFSILDPGSKRHRIPDLGSGSATTNLSILNPKNCYSALGNMIRDVHSGSRIQIFPFPDPGSRGQKAPDPGSATLDSEL
jgi:hypothetical protein